MNPKHRCHLITGLTILVALIGMNSISVAQQQIGGPKEDLAKLNVSDVFIGKGYAAKVGDQLTVLYAGKLNSGQVFDSNMDSAYIPDIEKEPFTFTLGARQVIAGWDKGMIGAKIGMVRKLDVPWNMGYGADGNGSIPANSDLFFTVKVLCVTRAGSPPVITSEDMKVGTGKKVKRSSTVTISYTGKMLNGKVYDKQASLKVPVKQLAVGFRQAIVGMKKGGIRKILWPLGAPNTYGQIPPNQPLEILVEVQSIK